MSGTNAGSSHELDSNLITAVNCNPPQMPTLPLCPLPISPICFNQAEVGDCWISVKMNQCGFGEFYFVFLSSLRRYNHCFFKWSLVAFARAIAAVLG